MPACFGASGSVRTVARPWRATCAPLVHTFCPLSSQPPSTRVARVRTPAASDPAAGSLNSWHQMTSWASADGTHRATCSGGPVLDQRQDDPAGDAVHRSLDPGGGELLLDHQLLDRRGVATPRLRPVRHRVARRRPAPRLRVPASASLTRSTKLADLGRGCPRPPAADPPSARGARRRGRGRRRRPPRARLEHRARAPWPGEGRDARRAPR